MSRCMQMFTSMSTVSPPASPVPIPFPIRTSAPAGAGFDRARRGCVLRAPQFFFSL